MMARVLVGAALAALCAWGLWWWFDTFEYVPDPPRPVERGPARYNRLYALERALRDAGYEASSVASLAQDGALPQGGTVVLADGEAARDERIAARLTAFVEGGGHLVLPAPDSSEAYGPLLHWLGLAPARRDEAFRFHPADCAPGHDDDSGAPDCLRRWAAARFDLAVVTPDRGWAGRIEAGQGHVTMLGSDALDNRALRSAERDDLVWWALAPNLGEGGGAVLLVYALQSDSLLVLAWRHGGLALLALAAALGAFIWMRVPRFGPLEPAPRPARRELLEHVLAGARLAWRVHDHEALNQALKQQVLLRAALPPDAIDEASIAELAKRSGLAADEVRLALRRQVPREPAAFIAHIASLTRLRRSL